MKTILRIGALACMAALAISALAQSGAPPTAAPSMRISIPADFNNARVREAAAYVASHPKGLTDLEAQLASKGSKSGRFHVDVVRYATLMQDIVANQGVDFASEYFWDLLRDATNMSPVAVAAGPVPQGPATPVILADKAADTSGEPVVVAANESGATGPDAVAVSQLPKVRKAPDAKAAAVSPESKGPAEPGAPGVAAVVTGPAGEATPEVLDGDKVSYEKLKADAGDLGVRIAKFDKIAADGSNAGEVAKAAKDLSAALKVERNENLAHQALLRAALAKANTADALKKAADAGKASAAAAADRAQTDWDLASASYDALHAQLGLQRAAPAEKKTDYLKLVAEQPGLTDALTKQQAEVDKEKPLVEAANKTLATGGASQEQKTAANKTLAEAKAADAKLADAQKKMDANVIAQRQLRDMVKSTTAANAYVAEPTPANKAARDDAANQQTALADSGNALSGTGKPASPVIDSPAHFSKIQAYFHAGVTLLNPYHINATAADAATGAPAKLSIAPASNTDTNAFLEFVYTNRWAWNAQRIANIFPQAPTPNDFKMDWHDQWDVEARLGYTFTSTPAVGSSTSSGTGTGTGTGATAPATTFSGSANTLVGSGNFNADISLGKPFILFRSDDEASYFSVGPEVSYGVVTDRSALSAHQRFFAGLAYSTSIRDPFGSMDVDNVPRRVLLHFRLGEAKIDTIRYKPDPSGNYVNNEIFTTNDNLPKYFRSNATAFEVELLYPVKTSTYVSFGGHVYTNVTPNPWSVQIGITTSFNDLVDGFFK